MMLALAMDDDSKSPYTKTPPQPTRHLHAPPPAAVFYRECLKNHAAGVGGLALDGCGEFLCSASAALSDPSSLKCAACGCHRNFHRRWLQDPKSLPRPPGRSRSPPSPDPLSLSSGHSDEQKGRNPFGRKRYRSKFSETQKEKMRAFAEKMGWRMRRSDGRAVEEFCNEVGVSRGVLKVWIHNNKLTLRNRDLHHHHHHHNNNIADNRNLQNEPNNGSSSS